MLKIYWKDDHAIMIDAEQDECVGMVYVGGLESDVEDETNLLGEALMRWITS